MLAIFSLFNVKKKSQLHLLVMSILPERMLVLLESAVNWTGQQLFPKWKRFSGKEGDP